MDPVTLALSKSWAEGEFGDLRPLIPSVKEVLDSRIVEQGSNSNGRYIRWENGLKICWKKYNTAMDISGNSVVEETWVYPVEFQERPFVGIAVEGSTNENYLQYTSFINPTINSHYYDSSRSVIHLRNLREERVQYVRYNVYAMGW